MQKQDLTIRNIYSKNLIVRLLFVFILIISTIAPSILLSSRTEALNGSQFNPGRIIDDSVFFNSNTMSAGQIQSFLNSKVPSCDTNHKKSTSPNDSGPPYTCLRDYRQNTTNIAPDSGLCKGYSGANNESAATIIYKVARSCGINPQVLLVMLQKEQSLITDTWPWKIQYDKAMGAFCPDTAPCDPQYKGFFYQVYYGAHRFKVYQANPNSFNYKAGRNNTIYYHPGPCRSRDSNGTCTSYYGITHCKSSSVYIENVATALLYIYTPYQPNKAALNNLYGTGDSCSSYGNRNFWRMFNDWFGSPIGPGYAASAKSIEMYTDQSSGVPVGQNNGQFFVTPGQTTYARIRVTNTGRNTWHKHNTLLGTAGPYDRKSKLYTNSWVAAHRAAFMNETSAAPGETASFSFPIKSPTDYGMHNEKFQVVVEGVAWVKNHTPTLSINAIRPFSAGELKDNAISSNATLRKGQSIESPEGTSYLKFQENGNLELYNNFKLVWQSKTAGSGAHLLANQTDGNLVLYSNSKAVWSSKTHGNGPGQLVMQTDGNLVLYSNSNGATWSTKTAGSDQTGTINLQMRGETKLFPNQRIYSPDRSRIFVLQTDGNLVLYSNSKAVWSSKTHGRHVSFLTLQSDGNLVMYGKGGAVWSSKTHGNGISRLVMQQDGNLVLYSTKKATWHTKTYNR